MLVDMSLFQVVCFLGIFADTLGWGVLRSVLLYQKELNFEGWGL